MPMTVTGSEPRQLRRFADAANWSGRSPSCHNGREDPVARITELTDGVGADVAFEAVGVPDTFELAASAAFL